MEGAVKPGIRGGAGTWAMSEPGPARSVKKAAQSRMEKTSRCRALCMRVSQDVQMGNSQMPRERRPRKTQATAMVEGLYRCASHSCA